MSGSPKVIFITGSSTGFGRHLVDAVLEQGDIAVATLRKPSVLDDLAAKFGQDRLLVLPLDVTKPQDITDAFTKVKEVYGRCDVVISNAGISAVAEAEATTEKAMRDMFEVNFFGAVELSKQAMAFFRENPTSNAEGHTFISISSRAGITTDPAVAAYAASKHAVEAYFESMGSELDPAWKIKIVSINPSLFKTNVVTNSVTLPPHPAYVSNPRLPSNYMRGMVAASASGQFGADPVKGAKAILGVVGKDPSPVRVPLGGPSVDGFRKKGRELLAAADEFEELARSMD